MTRKAAGESPPFSFVRRRNQNLAEVTVSVYHPAGMVKQKGKPLRQLRHLLLAAAAVATAAVMPASAGPFAPAMQKGGNTPLVLAQATDPAVFDLQEQVRSLNGKVEEGHLADIVRNSHFQVMLLQANVPGRKGAVSPAVAFCSMACVLPELCLADVFAEGGTAVVPAAALF